MQTSRILWISVICYSLLSMFGDSCYAEDWIPKPGYDGAIQFFGHDRNLASSGKTVETILKEIDASGESPKQQKDLLAELIIHFKPAEIPWQKLIDLSQSKSVHPDNVAFCVVVAGKALSGEEPPDKLVRWLFNTMEFEANTACGCGSAIALAASGIGVNTILQIWVSTIRDKEEIDTAFHMISTLATLSELMFGTISFNQGINCLIAGFDAEKWSVEKKRLFWDKISPVLMTGGIRASDQVTMWRLHSLALAEFANESNTEELRVFALKALRTRFPIGKEAKSYAECISADPTASQKLRDAALEIIDHAERKGTE